ncbi:MAG: hypothetical protein JNM56_24180 [Planctomycetia bacterium]|nr:hypothetical protein [Planctomycetia bacterium]
MPSPLRDPKSLPDWLELDYYQRPRPLRRWKWLIAVVVFLACVAIVGAVFFVPGNRLLYQAGPVSPVHNMFNNECGVCHTDSFAGAKRLLPGDAHPVSVPDSACSQCHSGPWHQEQQTFTPACASCHREHRGESLLHVADGHCTNCHADLKRKDGQPSPFQNITSFAKDHPEFALWRGTGAPDPGTIRFNHQLHLKADLRGPGGKPTQLDCLNCHRYDEQRQYFQPLSYEKNCKECHPLSVTLSGDWKDDQLKQAAQTFGQEAAPHREPAIVRSVLHDRLAQLAEKYPALLDTRQGTSATRPFPGKRPPEADPATTASWVNEQLQTTTRQLFDGAAGCRYCHQVSQVRTPAGLPEYAPSAIRQRWFAHARFRHDSHRQLACVECHAAPGSATTGDVLMPKIDTCKQCHGPPAVASTACVHCHGYHDWKHDGYRGKMTIQEFLRKK